MHEDDGRAALQFLEQRVVPGVPEIDTAGIAEQHDAVQAEVIEGVGQFGEGTVDVRQRQAGEAAEPVGPVAHHLGSELVAPAGQGTSRGVVAGVHAGGADRGDRDVDAGVVEERQHARPRPRRRRDPARRVVGLVGGLEEEVGQDVVVVSTVKVTVASRSAGVDALVDALGQHDDCHVGGGGGDFRDDRGVDQQPADALDGAHRVNDGPTGSVEG